MKIRIFSILFCFFLSFKCFGQVPKIMRLTTYNYYNYSDSIIQIDTSIKNYDTFGHILNIKKTSEQGCGYISVYFYNKIYSVKYDSLTKIKHTKEAQILYNSNAKNDTIFNHIFEQNFKDYTIEIKIKNEDTIHEIKTYFIKGKINKIILYRFKNRGYQKEVILKSNLFKSEKYYYLQKYINDPISKFKQIQNKINNVYKTYQFDTLKNKWRLIKKSKTKFYDSINFKKKFFKEYKFNEYKNEYYLANYSKYKNNKIIKEINYNYSFDTKSYIKIITNYTYNQFNNLLFVYEYNSILKMKIPRTKYVYEYY